MASMERLQNTMEMGPLMRKYILSLKRRILLWTEGRTPLFLAYMVNS